MNDQLRMVIETKFRETVEKGGVTAVVGWRDSNHNNFTRTLMETGKVLFIEDLRNSLPKKVEFVLFTRFVGHGTIQKVKKSTMAYNQVCEIGEIKRLLKWVQLSPVALISSPLIPQPLNTTAEESELQDEVEVKTAPDFVGFTAQFKQIADDHRSGWVGRRTLGKLRAQFRITESSDKLVSLHWINSHIGTGKTEIGWYSAGEKMMAQEIGKDGPSTVSTPVSDNPRIMKMMQALSDEPALREEKERLEGQLKEITERLSQIEFLKDAVDALS